MNIAPLREVSVLFSEPKISQSRHPLAVARCGARFQCSSASRKFLNLATTRSRAVCGPVSVLFSEPKISQFLHRLNLIIVSPGFSALQRAENFSILRKRETMTCSHPCFSALQRAENFSIVAIPVIGYRYYEFQCSSASRKFLNQTSQLVSFLQRNVSVLFSEPKISQLSV